MKATSPDSRPMVCELCHSTRIWAEENVGWDIDPTGEEEQHLDHCEECGAERLWFKCWDFLHDGPELQQPYYAWGNWFKEGER